MVQPRPVGIGKPISRSNHTFLRRSSTTTSRRGKNPRYCIWLLVVGLCGASLSFYHTVDILSSTTTTSSSGSNNNNNNNNNNEHVVSLSLADFRQSTTSRQQHQNNDSRTTRTINDDNNKNHPSDTDDTFSIDQPEDPISNPPLSDGNSTFSACLLVMDDNHRLTEWLAYHYHVLPLRTLLVAVDPRSKTSPTKVLNRWRKMGLYIEEWNDQQFLKPEIANNVIPDDAELQIKRDRHRIRQKNFYRKCLETFKRMDRTWVTLIDTDEFLMYNHRAERYEEWEQQQQQVHTARQYKGRRIALSQPPPSPADPGGMIRYLHREQVAGHPYFQPPCISCPRLQFGAKESTHDETYYKVPPPILQTADRLDTLRYRKHAERQDFVKNGLSKSILDVSRIDKFPRIQSLHRPIKEICSAPWKDEWSSGLRINHYLGSWEAYSFRDDSRRGGERSYEGWVFKAMDADETDDNIRPWIRGFVETYGPDKSKELLQGSGLPPQGYQPASNPNNNNHNSNNKNNNYDKNALNWTILFLDEILAVNETKGNDNRVAFDSFVRDFHLRKNLSLEGIL
ncbi:hypothetical protein IV203_005021 [Nitzschia inconspicua]|uniref:Glycosyltransferase family 92 protein n=1 Tax=Nitzschia inconspicua TaxID=303405 RepID=A0A9K3KMQ2_9STRA|nr:hypothetical protein IV203_005021 [Nitzschia inconspicua]